MVQIENKHSLKTSVVARSNIASRLFVVRKTQSSKGVVKNRSKKHNNQLSLLNVFPYMVCLAVEV